MTEAAPGVRGRPGPRPLRGNEYPHKTRCECVGKDGGPPRSAVDDEGVCIACGHERGGRR